MEFHKYSKYDITERVIFHILTATCGIALSGPLLPNQIAVIP